MSLLDEVCQKIASSPNQVISFYDYMNMCLYHETLGYYRTQREKIGKEGDFYTSSALGGLLAETVVFFMLHKAQDYIKTNESFQFVEWGGGTGQFALQFLDELQSRDTSAYNQVRYIMIETSDFHRAGQQQLLAKHSSRLIWCSAEQWWREPAKANTFVFSNELLDAFPVHRVQLVAGNLHEICVAYENGALVERLQPIANDSILTAYVRHHFPRINEGQRVEVNLQAVQWMERVLAHLEGGVVMTIDYGDIAEELAAPHRMAGTLMCYYRHTATDNPLERPGEQDITAHINFSALQELGANARLRHQSLQTQKQFLIENGLLDKLQETIHIRDPFHPAVKRNRFIRQILISDQMSELFKVLIQSK